MKVGLRHSFQYTGKEGYKVAVIGVTSNSRMYYYDLEGVYCIKTEGPKN